MYVSFRTVVENLVREAMEVYPMDAPGLNSSTHAYTYKPAEGIAVALFLTRKALEVLDVAEHLAVARDYLTKVFMVELRHYCSEQELQEVVPLLTQRYFEYSAILDAPGDPGDRYLELGRVMFQYLVNENVEDVGLNLAILFLLERLLVDPSRKIRSLEEAGEIKWSAS